MFPDWHSDRFSTQLDISLDDAQTLRQSLSFGGQTLTSNARIAGSRLLFENGNLPVQVLLLPDGASANCPLAIAPRQSFVLEVGWAIAPNRRQRLVRRYDASGTWTSVTWIQEEKC